MEWLSNIFAAVKEALGLARQSLDPEVIRLAKLRSIDDELNKQRAKRDQLIAIKITVENEEQQAIDLGVVSDNIIRLRAEREAFIR